jgi:hypothetical protein
MTQICAHNSPIDEASCGCWLDEEGEVRKHAFRFAEGDRVHWAGYRGVTGTVKRGSPNIWVEWDERVANWAPTAFPANFEIRHQGS